LKFSSSRGSARRRAPIPPWPRAPSAVCFAARQAPSRSLLPAVLQPWHISVRSPAPCASRSSLAAPLLFPRRLRAPGWSSPLLGPCRPAPLPLLLPTAPCFICSPRCRAQLLSPWPVLAPVLGFSIARASLCLCTQNSICTRPPLLPGAACVPLARHPAVLPCACESPCVQLASAPCSSTARPISFVLSSSFSRLALAFIIDVVTSVVKVCSAIILYCASYPSRHPKSVVPYSNLANHILVGHRFIIRHGATPLLNPVSTPPWRSSSSSPSSTHPCVRSSSIEFRACLRLPSSRRTRHPLLNPTSPARSRHNLVIVPRVIKKSQESGEDEAHSVVFTKCANKSSSVILVYAKSPSRENTLVLATRHELDKINPMGI
jgi:hypothetical protein